MIAIIAIFVNLTLVKMESTFKVIRVILSIYTLKQTMASISAQDRNSRTLNGPRGAVSLGGQYKVASALCFVLMQVGAWPYSEDVAKGIAHEPTCMYRSHNEDVLAVGDDTGMLKVYNYPCVSKQVWNKCIFCCKFSSRRH